MKIEQIAIDLDGVLADFSKRFKELYKDEPETDYISNNKKNELYKKKFHEFIENKNFSNLDPMEDLQVGLEYLRTLDVHIWLLTSTAREEYLNEVSSQKRIWLKNNNIEWNPVFVPGKKLKCYYAKPGRILIDDTLSNIEQWEENCGIGIHHKSWEETINKLKEYF
jgi:hypothetical protein